MPFKFSNLQLPGVVLAEPRVFSDGRGWFMEMFKQSDFQNAGIPGPFVQQNQSLSQAGTLRGLHFQRAPKAQGKLVRVLAGEIFDVAVDMRRSSATCGKWVGVTLSAANRKMLFVPPWCAHGFYVTGGDPADVLYMATGEYSAPHEGGCAWDDPQFAISWPLAPGSTVPEILADRDRQWPPFDPIDWPEPGAAEQELPNGDQAS
jgi:dTDP-4-dehydrorhamnose 3,5-epimerase